MSYQGPAKRLWLGIEQEFELFHAGRKIDFRKHFHQSVALLPHQTFRNLQYAVAVDAGYALYCDEIEAEFATAPIDFLAEGSQPLLAETILCRQHMCELLQANPSIDSVRGYSTHFNISVPQEILYALVPLVTRTIAPVIMLLTEGKNSPGLLVRPRFGHLEIGTEYVDEPQRLLATMQLIIGGVYYLIETIEKQISPKLQVCIHRTEPGVMRGGVYLPRDAYGINLHRYGRNAQLHLVDGQSITLQTLLENYIDIAIPILTKMDLTFDATPLQEAMTSAWPLGIEQDSISTVNSYAASIKRSQLAQALAIAATPPETLKVLFLDWEGGVFTDKENKTKKIVGLPLAAIPPFINAVKDSGFYVTSLTMPEGKTKKLDHLHLLNQPFIYHEVDINALTEEANASAAKKIKLKKDLPPDRPPDKPPNECHLTIQGDDSFCANKKSVPYIAQSDKPGNTQFKIDQGPIEIISSQGQKVEIRATGLGHAILSARHQANDGSVCYAKKNILVKGVMLVPANRPLPQTTDELPIALWQYHPVFIFDHANQQTITPTLGRNDIIPHHSGNLANASRDSKEGTRYQYQIKLTGQLDEPSKQLREIHLSSEHTLTVNKDFSFELTLALVGVGKHRVIISVRNGLGQLATLRLLITITPKANQDYQRQAQALKVDLHEERLSELYDTLGQDTDQATASALTIQSEYNDKYQQASQRYFDLQDIVEQNVDVVVEYDQVALETGEGIFYQLVGYADAGADTATFSIGRRHYAVAMEESAENYFVSTQPKLFAFVNDHLSLSRTSTLLSMSATSPFSEEVETIFTQPNKKINLQFDSCGGIARTYGFDLENNFEYKDLLLPLLENGVNTAHLTLTVQPKPKKIGRQYAHLNWDLLVAPPQGKNSQLTGGNSESNDFFPLHPGRYVVRVNMDFADDTHATHIYRTIHVLGGQLFLEVDDADYEVMQTNNGHRLGPMVIAIASHETNVTASLALTKHPLDDALSQLIETNWSLTAQNATIIQSHIQAFDIIATTQVTFSSDFQLHAQLNHLRYRGESLELGSLGERMSTPLIQVRPGPAHHMQLQGQKPGQSAWTDIPLHAFDFDLPNLNLPGNPLPAVLQMSTSSEERLNLRVRIFDELDRPVIDQTDVIWRLIGSGDIGDVPTKPVNSTIEGWAYKQIQASFDGRYQAIMIVSGSAQFWFGAPSSLVNIQLATIHHAAVQPEGMIAAERIISLNSGDPRIQLTAHLNNLQLPEGTEVLWTITKGSLFDTRSGHWSPSASSFILADGRSVVRVSPAYYSKDGSLSLLKPEAWGEAKVRATIGVAEGELDVYFLPASLSERPRVILPDSGMLRQTDLRWVPKWEPVPSGSFDLEHPYDYTAADQSAPDHNLEIHADSNNKTYVDLNENRHWVVLNSYDATRILGNRVVGQSGPAFTGMLALVMHEGTLERATSTLGAEVIRMLEPWPSQNIPYLLSDPIPQLTNFRIEITLYASQLIHFANWESVVNGGLLMRGGGPHEQYGYWELRLRKLVQVGNFIGHEFRFIFYAAGCSNLNPIRETVVVQQNLHDFARQYGDRVTIWFSVQGDPSGGVNHQGIVRLGIGVMPFPITQGGVRTYHETEHFNWIAGEHQTFKIMGNHTTDIDIRELIVKTALNRNLNFTFDHEGEKLLLATFRAEKASDYNGIQVSDDRIPDGMTLTFYRDPNPEIPTYINSIEPAMKLTARYCDDQSVSEIQVPALDIESWRSYKQASDYAWGFITGESNTWRGVVGDMIAGFLLYGDARDIVKNLAYWGVAGGEDADWLTTAVATLGLLADIGTLFTGGVAMPINIAVGVLKPALRMMRKAAESIPLLKPLLDRVGSTLAREVQIIFVKWKAGELAAAGSLLLSIAPLFAALIDYFVPSAHQLDPRVADHLVNFGKRCAGEPVAIIAGRLAYIYWKDIELDLNTPGIAGEIAAVRIIGELVLKRFTDLMVFLNPQVNSIDEFIELLHYLARRPPNPITGLQEFGLIAKRREVYYQRALALTNAGTSLPHWTHLDASKWMTKFPDRLHAVASNISQIIRQLAVSNAYLSEAALDGLAGHIFYLGPYRTQELIMRFAPQHVSHTVSAATQQSRSLLEKIGIQMNMAFSAATRQVDELRLDPHYSGLNLDNAENFFSKEQAIIFQFLSFLSGGHIVHGTTDKIGWGTLWELDTLERLMTQIPAHSSSRIHIAPRHGQTTEKVEDLLLLFEEPVGNIPSGHWISECKALYPTSDGIKESVDRLQKQFFRRLTEAMKRNISLDFAYFFRGRHEEKLVDALLEILDSVFDVGTWWARVDDKVVRSADAAPNNRPTARLIIEHGDIPFQELEHTSKPFDPLP